MYKKKRPTLICLNKLRVLNVYLLIIFFEIQDTINSRLQIFYTKLCFKSELINNPYLLIVHLILNDCIYSNKFYSLWGREADLGIIITKSLELSSLISKNRLEKAESGGMNKNLSLRLKLHTETACSFAASRCYLGVS